MKFDIISVEVCVVCFRHFREEIFELNHLSADYTRSM